MRTTPYGLNIGLKILVVVLLTLTLGACDDKPLSTEQAAARLDKITDVINASVEPVPGIKRLDQLPNPDITRNLPDISEYPLTVNPFQSGDSVVAEIFVTTIRGWSPDVGGRARPADGLTTEIAQAFNESDQRLIGGRRAKVRVRYIASGTAYQFISSGRYLPDAYSPVHRLWIRMLQAADVPVAEIRQSTVASTGGVVVRNEIARRIRSEKGYLDVKAIIDEVVQGDLSMGYTNPFASSTGLNFLATVLSTFAEGDEAEMLSPAVKDTFVRFQMNVPFVALTTVEMRESVLNGGSLDAFVMGYQSFISTKQLQSGFEFIPFGVAHDQPLYAVGDPGPAKLEVLELFARFAERPEYRELARKYGWDLPVAVNFTPTIEAPSGKTLLEAQKLWKEKKDAGRPIAAVFVGDVSGSMDGERLFGVKHALGQGSDFISAGHSVGLVTFSGSVRVVLPLGRFNLKQRARFAAAVGAMQAGGNTAMYDGIAVGLSMLVAEMERNPDVKPMLFVLTDGETNTGLGFREIEEVIEGLGIPVSTIGYEANLDELTRVARLVEATTMNAGESNVAYKLASLFQAKM